MKNDKDKKDIDKIVKEILKEEMKPDSLIRTSYAGVGLSELGMEKLRQKIKQDEINKRKNK